MLPGISGNAASRGSGGGLTTLTFATNTNGSKTTSSPDFTSVNIGTAANDRYVIVAVMTSGTGFEATTPSDLTVAGAACTKLAEQCAGGFLPPRLQVWITNAPVTSGTTATISMTLSTNGNVGIATWALNATLPTVFQSKEGLFLGTISDPLNTTINVADKGSVVAVSALYAATSVTQSFTGVTKNFEGTDGTSNFSAASLSNGSAETNRAISFTSDGSGGSGNPSAYAIISFTGN